MEKYIKPSIKIAHFEVQSFLLAGSNLDSDLGEITEPLSKRNNGFDSFGDFDESDPTPQTFNVWED